MELMSIEANQDLDLDNHEELQRSQTQLENSYKEKISYLADKYDNSELKCVIDDPSESVYKGKLKGKTDYSPSF